MEEHFNYKELRSKTLFPTEKLVSLYFFDARGLLCIWKCFLDQFLGWWDQMHLRIKRRIIVSVRLPAKTPLLCRGTGTDSSIRPHTPRFRNSQLLWCLLSYRHKNILSVICHSAPSTFVLQHYLRYSVLKHLIPLRWQGMAMALPPSGVEETLPVNAVV